MGLREIRKQKNMTQKELAQISGVNFRSLQDYEQGHKRLSSASGDVLLRLSTVLGCTIEDLLFDGLKGAEILEHNRLDINVIQMQKFYCEKYHIMGRWVCVNDQIATLFYYNGEQYVLPFRAVFTPSMLPCLKEAAILQIEAKIDELNLVTNGFEIW